MAIDFEEEEEPKIALAICSQHNLKYDPGVTSGCVLCRANRTKRISGYWLVAGIFGLAAGVFFLLPVLRPKTEPTLSSVVAVGDMSTDISTEIDDPAVDCRVKLSAQIEKCIASVDSSSPNARMDSEFCLNGIRDGNGNCDAKYLEQKYDSEPLYSVNPIPLWAQIREPFEENQEQIERCVESTTYDFAVRVSVERSSGKPFDVTLSLFGLDTGQRFCLYEFIKSLEFPGNAQKDYTFVTNIQSATLALNRPEKKDTRKESFDRALAQQRNARLYEERHAEIMKKREEFDKKFKSEMTNR